MSSDKALSLPPFGLIVEAYQKETIKLEVPIYIFVGKNAFEEAKQNKAWGTMAMCLPYETPFENYRWPIKDQKIVIVDTGFMSAISLKKMCYYLLKFKPRVICLYSDTGCELFTPPKESNNE